MQHAVVTMLCYFNLFLMPLGFYKSGLKGRGDVSQLVLTGGEVTLQFTYYGLQGL